MANNTPTFQDQNGRDWTLADLVEHALLDDSLTLDARWALYYDVDLAMDRACKQHEPKYVYSGHQAWREQWDWIRTQKPSHWMPSTLRRPGAPDAALCPAHTQTKGHEPRSLAKSQQAFSLTILAPRKVRLFDFHSENVLGLNNSNTWFGIICAMKTTTQLLSRMGTSITPKSKPDKEGYLKAIFHFEHGDSQREIHLSDIRSEGGAREIMELVATLPPFPTK